MHMRKTRQTGFTLIELLITVTVSIILLGVGVPGFMGLVNNNRLSTSTNDFVQSLHLARSEAIRGGSAIVCASSDQATCTGTWEQGWVLLDGTGKVVRIYGALPDSVTVTSATTSKITFGNNGFLSPAGIQQVFLCHSSGSGRMVSISTSGRPSTDPQGC